MMTAKQQHWEEDTWPRLSKRKYLKRCARRGASLSPPTAFSALAKAKNGHKLISRDGKWTVAYASRVEIWLDQA